LPPKLSELVGLLLKGPLFSVPRSYCNPYHQCSFKNGLLRWVWISSKAYGSLKILVLNGLLVDAEQGRVLRGYVVLQRGAEDGLLRFYSGPVLLKNVPARMECCKSAKGALYFSCKCGEDVRADVEHLVRHLLEKHVGDERPTRLELEAYVQAALPSAYIPAGAKS